MDVALHATRAGADLATRTRETETVLFCTGRESDEWCRDIDARIDEYRRVVVAPGRDWLAKHPLGPAPDPVLYPFAGGDLAAVLNLLPATRWVVLLSLEQGGPPLPFLRQDFKTRWEARLRFGRTVVKYLGHGISFTRDLERLQYARLPGVLPMMLLGLKVHGAVVVGLRYLRLDDDGRVRAYSERELVEGGLEEQWNTAAGRPSPRARRRFAHLELRYRLPGDRADRLLRHFAGDLSDAGLKRSPGLLPMIRNLGPHTLFLKASSYLLWEPRFDRTRSALFEEAPLLVADASAPAPTWLRERGYRIRAHGRFACKVVDDFRWHAKPWVQEFARQAPEPLPFRFGYRDCKQQNSLIVARRERSRAR